MSDFLRLLLIFFAAVNPASALGVVAAARLQNRVATVGIGATGGLAILLVAVLFESSIISALELEQSSFRVAAGAVLAVAGGLAIVRGVPAYTVEDGWRGALFPVAVPLIAGPAAIASAIAYPGLYGGGKTAIAAICVVLLTAVAAFALARRPHAAFGALARITGVILMALAASLVVEGIRDI